MTHTFGYDLKILFINVGKKKKDKRKGWHKRKGSKHIMKVRIKSASWIANRIVEHDK